MKLTRLEKRWASGVFDAILPMPASDDAGFLDAFFSCAPVLPALGVRFLLALGAWVGVRRVAASRLYVARESLVLLKALAIFARGSGARP